MRVLLLRVQEKTVVLNPIEAYPTSAYISREKPVISRKKPDIFERIGWLGARARA
jgi:hypothetical protein